MRGIITQNAAALLVALLIFALAVLALAGADVPTVLADALPWLVGGAVGAQLPQGRAAR